MITLAQSNLDPRGLLLDLPLVIVFAVVFDFLFEVEAATIASSCFRFLGGRLDRRTASDIVMLLVFLDLAGV